MKPGKNISIVVASDNHYAILIAALLKSIDINHKTPEHIDFYIIDDGISEKSVQKLNTIADPGRITLKWIKSKDAVPKDITIPIDSSGFPLTAYMRVFSPYVIDQDADRLIYLDVDTIVQDDISKLWNIPLGDYTVAAAQDPGKTFDCAWGGVPNYAQLGLPADTPYFNSGVLLIDPKKWRAEGISNEVISALSKYKESVRMADQYGLNVAFANKWLMLDPKWNWFAFQENVEPFIVHFLDIKPIFTSYNGKDVYGKEFFRYLSMTPWKSFTPISGTRRKIRKIFNRIKKALMVQMITFRKK
jgi:lipopolysaccharide biosynthesis glycosyltransferase